MPNDRPKIEDPEERLIEEMMERVCAWCNTGMGQTRGPVGSVTHGICTACFETFFPDVELPEGMPGRHCISPRLFEEVMKLLEGAAASQKDRDEFATMPVCSANGTGRT